MKRPNQKRTALSYARSGFPVLLLHSVVQGKCPCRDGASCKSPGKHPMTRNGVHDATTDLKQVRVWFTKHPNANIGIATGAEFDLLALDIDPRNGGNETLAKAKNELGDLPLTVEA